MGCVNVSTAEPHNHATVTNTTQITHQAHAAFALRHSTEQQQHSRHWQLQAILRSLYTLGGVVVTVANEYVSR